MAKPLGGRRLIDQRFPKLCAHIGAREVKYAKRYQLGQLLGGIAENLLLTAAPHNGKPEGFQLFTSLVDRDRFGGARRIKPRKAALWQEILSETNTSLPFESRKQELDVSDVMRRLVREGLLRLPSPEAIRRSLRRRREKLIVFIERKDTLEYLATERLDS